MATIETAKKFRFFLYGPFVRYMTFLQRICGFFHAVSQFSPIFGILLFLMIPAGVISGYEIVAFADHKQLRRLIRAFFLVLFFNQVSSWTISLPSTHSFQLEDSSTLMWMAPCKSRMILFIGTSIIKQDA